MTPEEIQAMAKGLAEGQALWYLLSAITGGAVTGLGSYLAEKSKNRATKEDIANITKAVEEAKKTYIREIEDLKATHQLRHVAAEKRMHAHQQAYVQWHVLSKNLKASEEEWEKLIDATNAWYVENCFYLGKEARRAIVLSVNFFKYCRQEFAAGHQRAADDWYSRACEKVAALFNEVALPSLSAEDIKTELASKPA